MALNPFIARGIPIIDNSGHVNINPDNYLNAFKTENWNRLSTGERLNALQQLENHAAFQQGRIAREVVPNHSLDNKPSTRGFYNDMEAGQLSINPNLLNNDNSFVAMETTLHEGRHAYQNDIINGLASVSNNKDPFDRHLTSKNEEVWRQNNIPGNYYHPRYGDKFSEYRYQPVEADANNYSDKYMQYLGEMYSNDPGYQRWADKRNAYNQLTVNCAIEEGLGENPESAMKYKILGPEELQKHKEKVQQYEVQQQTPESKNQQNEKAENTGKENSENQGQDNSAKQQADQQQASESKNQQNENAENTGKNESSNKSNSESQNSSQSESNDYYYGYGY